MNRNWNWQGWVAIALAGLALIVAMGGRADWGAQRQAMMWAQSQQAPDPSSGRSFGRGESSQRDQPAAPSRGDTREPHGGMMGKMDRHGGHSPFSFFGVFGMLGGLAKLIGLGLLAWLLFRLFTQRRNGTPPAAPVQTTPAGHDPTVE